MIKSFKNKSLRRYWQKGQAKGINPQHLSRVKNILSLLEAAKSLVELNLPGYHLHELKQYRPSRWSMRVSGNWRITFRWNEGEVHEVDYEDYH